jgi:hypothetical protein
VKLGDMIPGIGLSPSIPNLYVHVGEIVYVGLALGILSQEGADQYVGCCWRLSNEIHT